MRCKLITLFLFLGASTWTASQRNRSDIAGFELVNPRQIQRAEITIKHFLTRLTGPIAQPITLRLSSPDGGSLQGTISEICKIIRAKIMEFARASGLTTSVRQYEQMPWNSTISEDWFTENLIQGSLLLRDLARIKEEIEFEIDHYFNLYNITLGKNKESSSRQITKSFTFLSGIDDITKLNEALFKCLMSRRDRNNLISFDLSRVLANLAKGSPGNTVKSFKFRLDRAFSHFTPSNGTTTEQLYVLLCHSLVEKANHYGDCTKEFRRFVDCMSSSNQDSNGVIAHRTLPAKTWLTAIQDISDCKISIVDGITSCVNFNRKLPRTAAQQVKYIYEKILNRRISIQSPLYRVANELGDVLSKSKWGKQFIYDVCQYFEIYQEGRKRLNTLSKSAAKDKRATMRYRKISKSLHVYKNGILRKTILAISDFHHSASEMQKFFIRMMGSSLKQSWQGHVKIFSCLSEWMTKLLELFGCTNSDDTDSDTPITTTTSTSSTNMIDFDSAMISDEFDEENNKKIIKVSAMNLKKYQMRKNTDKAFERLMWSMNNVSRIRSKNNRTTLACLANNLLLAAMFIETISLISTLFCLDHKSESNFEELTEEWDSPGREHRSLFPTDFADSSIVLESYEEIVNIHNEENINST